jgi:pyruvate dehydrogenase E1 component beta subunit
MARLTIVQALNQTLRYLLATDQRVILLGEDVGRDGGVFRVTEGLVDEFGPDRVVDTPLAESAIIGTSVGLAASGLRPIPEIQFFGFLLPAFEQLVTQAARLHARSAGRHNIALVVRTPYGGGVRTPELHSDAFESYFVHAPGLKVVAVSTPYNAKGLLLSAYDDPDPVLFLEPLRTYRAMREEVPDEPYRVPLGQARVARPGRDVTLVAWSGMVPVVERAAELLAEQDGVEAEVIDLQTLSPLDETTLVASVQKTGRAVVVHEAVRTGGLGAEIAALIMERGFLSLEAPVMRVTSPDVPYPPTGLEGFFLPDAERVVEAVRASLRY